MDEGPEETQPVDVNADDKTRIRQSHAIVIPSYASWFNMKKIHQIEKDSLPEFFETSHPSKSPVIYADYRNFMINAYRLNPNEYLTLTSCRRTLVGDVGTLMRVHRFLNKWGLINYQVNPQFKPAYALEKAPDGKVAGLPYCGDFHVQYDTPRGLFPFNTYKPLQENVNVEKLKELVSSEQSNSAGKRDLLEAPLGEDGMEPLSKKQKVDSGDWSPKELANLLLGIQKHENDWYMVAKMVGGGRTPQDCILKFLKLPIEDKYNKLSDDDLGILKFASNFPVMTADNPVISNLVFMTNLVDAEVVKAASGNASKVIDETLFKKVKEIYEEKVDSDPKPSSEEENKDVQSQDDKELSKESIDEKLKEEFDSHTSDSAAEVLCNASTAVLGLVGARSHLFANYEEREMQRLTNTILNQELTKLDLKMKKIKELETAFQRERKNLAHQQNQIFTDRLALTRSTIDITKKLHEAVRLLKPSEQSASSGANEDNLANVTRILDEVQGLLFKPAKYSLKEAAEDKPTEAASSESEAAHADTKASNLGKPLSVVEPQSFKVWAP
ncbi:SWIRM-domain-containing protein [Metschnikowia bicuspidata var. bicuspidata NRRL YB-4993]|uniref:SWIRM-domain-containing protein n=1 Tax=Metschnikowia bicuspidata var. bicuspidata NRRL YB-4993 TaxID=869754 RepID=A0A1A0HB64_9ASCO|nr:SWIRM-domain-containing protein [Metschnikowia bicuspidata var. bicuspidata NRRL YB-4993]OBA21369.1 SWIRM-domain-containing protein [Metschnikowia bicuspidata var. bicuspidata NRRL YB-4993]